jgi:hypothetical protein
MRLRLALVLFNVCMGHLDSQRSLPALGADKLGFSPLCKKLRLAAGHSVVVLNAPDGFLSLFTPGPAGIKTQLDGNGTYDAVVLFVKDVDELHRLGSGAVRAANPSGLLWIAYPKGGKTGGATDLPATPWWVQNDVLGDVTAERGYKPVAFVAVDEGWTALRFKKL